MRSLVHFLARCRPQIFGQAAQLAPSLASGQSREYVVLQFPMPVHVTGFIVLGSRVLASVAVRYKADSQFRRGLSTVWIDPDSTERVLGKVFEYKVEVPDSLWRGYAVS